jgi:hypothetical protein
MADTSFDFRPRTTGEVLDDAWRLALADAPLLLVFLALFQVPAFLIVVLLLTQAPDGPMQLLLPALAALFVPLMGIGSGACQELFRRRLEEQPVGPVACLWGGLSDGLRHTAARAVVLAGALVGMVFLLLPGLLLWAAAAPLHALIAGQRRGSGLLAELRSEAAVDPAKAVAVTLLRLPMLLVAVINLHLLLHAGLWVAENFVGLDTALLAASLSLFGNSVYTLGLILLTWLLLSPFFEAANFLLHLDARTRLEGLDLFYRIRRVFPAAERAGPVLGVLALAALLFAAPAARAAGTDLETVRAVRIEVEKVREEIRSADPYPGSGHWLNRLQRLGSRLEDGEWFRQALEGFAAREREGALHVVGELQRRLLALEDALALAHRQPGAGGPAATPEEIRSLLRKHGASRPRERPKPKEIEPKEKQPDVEPDRDPEPRAGRRGMRPVVPSAAWEGLGAVGWGVFLAIVLALVGLAVWRAFLWWREQRARKPAEARPTVVQQQAEVLPPPDERSAAELWRRAEAAAREADFRQALRWLYLAVLYLLDSRQLLRYEPTRTNGEYLRQLRRAEQAPEAVQEPFRALTTRFETSWYGDAATVDSDYREFRRLAEVVRDTAA